MASYYPHKQTVIITIVCILVVAGAFIYTKTSDTSIKDRESDIPSSDIGLRGQEDTVSSTSSDWRASFIENTTASSKTTSSKPTLSEPLTLTDQFGRDFFARYIQMKQSGLIDNQQFVQSTLDQSINTAVQSAKPVKIYGVSDIIVTTQTDLAVLKAYGNSVGKILSDYGVDTDAAVVANTAFDKGDMTILAQLDPIIRSYENIASALKALPVPQALSVYHLELLNAVSGMASVVRDLRNVEGDPMQTMVSIGSYSTIQSTIVSALKKMGSYFSIVGISFSSNEPGDIFSSNL